MVRGEGDPARAARLSWAWVGWKDEGEEEDSEGAMLGWGWRERKSGLCCRCDGQTLDWISKDWGSASGAETKPSSLETPDQRGTGR